MDVRVACCQFTPDVTDRARSASLGAEAIAAALAERAQLIILPELANSGYVFESAREARAAAVRPDFGDWRRLLSGSDALLVTGFAELGADGRVYNSSALIDAGGVIAVYRKLHLWGHEREWFSPGDSPAPVVETRHGRIGLAVCYDLEFPELTRGLALGGAELIALPANWPLERPQRETGAVLHSLAATTAYLSKVFVAVCDRCGIERGLEFQGGSVIAAPDGTFLAGPVADRGVATLCAGCELERARDKRIGKRNDAFADRRPEHYEGALVG